MLLKRLIGVLVNLELFHGADDLCVSNPNKMPKFLELVQLSYAAGATCSVFVGAAPLPKDKDAPGSKYSLLHE
jgi:hypothetical protein